MSTAVARLVIVMCIVAPLAACSNSSGPAQPPVLERIDGPAQVDPSYDPFATVPPATAPPATTDPGG